MQEAPSAPPTSLLESSSRATRKTRKFAVRGFMVLLLLLLALALFFFLHFKTVVVSGDSMIPTFQSGQKVLVSDAYWLVGQVRRKDIVVVKDDGPTGYFIKRVYRMGGEEVDYANAPKQHRLELGPYVVPDGQLFVVGDNRRHSEDSREFGPVKMEKVIGKVVVIP